MDAAISLNDLSAKDIQSVDSQDDLWPSEWIPGMPECLDREIPHQTSTASSCGIIDNVL